MSLWARLLGGFGGSDLPKAYERKEIVYSPNYRAYDVSYDEEVTATSILEQVRLHDPIAVDLANTRFKAFENDFVAETDALTRQALRTADELRAAFPDRNWSLSVLCVLIDHSQSMRRGGKVELALLLMKAAERLSQALGCRLELLGFTTVNWKGDPLRNLWRAEGSPPMPGRLCALRHIVYCSTDMESPVGEPLMYLEGALKENVDGEAMLWAVSRLREQSVESRVLLHVSDGAPVDDCTLKYNDDAYLLRHRDEVAAELVGSVDIAFGTMLLGPAPSWREAVTLTDRTIEVRGPSDICDRAFPLIVRLLKRGPRSEGE